MEDLRIKQHKKKSKLSFKIRHYLILLKRNKWKVILYILLILMLIFPTYFGQIIGEWLNQFLGTMIKYLIG